MKKSLQYQLKYKAKQFTILCFMMTIWLIVEDTSLLYHVVYEIITAKLDIVVYKMDTTNFNRCTPIDQNRHLKLYFNAM